ncbi:hypothetical protein D3C87_1598770 [compost metagenome]
MIGASTRDYFLLLRATDGIVVVPDQLDSRVIGLRPGIGEEYFRHGRGRQRDQFFREADSRFIGFVSKRMIERQRAHLTVSCIRQPGLAKTEGSTKQPTERFQITFSGVVVDVYALTPSDHHGADPFVQAQVRVWMQRVLHISAG